MDSDSEYRAMSSAAAAADHELEVSGETPSFDMENYKNYGETLRSFEQFSLVEFVFASDTQRRLMHVLLCLLIVAASPAFGIIFPFTDTADFKAIPVQFPAPSKICRLFSSCVDAGSNAIAPPSAAINASVFDALNAGAPVTPALKQYLFNLGFISFTSGANDCECGSIRRGNLDVSGADGNKDQRFRCAYPVPASVYVKYYNGLAAWCFTLSTVLQLYYIIFVMLHAKIWWQAIWFSIFAPISLFYWPSQKEREPHTQWEHYSKYLTLESIILLINVVGITLLAYSANLVSGNFNDCVYKSTGTHPQTTYLTFIYILWNVMTKMIPFGKSTIDALRNQGFSFLDDFQPSCSFCPNSILRYWVVLVVLAANFFTATTLYLIVRNAQFKY